MKQIKIIICCFVLLLLFNISNAQSFSDSLFTGSNADSLVNNIHLNISLCGYGGVCLGVQPGTAKIDYGLAARAGVAFTLAQKGMDTIQGMPRSITAFLSLVDASLMTGKLQNINWHDWVSPGLYIYYDLQGSPISVGMGGQWLQSQHQVLWGAGVLINLPLLNLQLHDK